MMPPMNYQAWLANALHSEGQPFDCGPEVIAEFMIRFNNEIGEIIARHGVEQAGKAVWNTYDLMSSYIGYSLRNNGLVTALSVLESVKKLYLYGFNVYCAKHGPDHHYTMLDMACEMLWDMDSIEYAVQANDELLTKAFEVLEYALHLPNPMCQTSAIHGLGHMASNYPQPPGEILDKYLRSELPSDDLRQYAEEAKTGLIL